MHTLVAVNSGIKLVGNVGAVRTSAACVFIGVARSIGVAASFVGVGATIGARSGGSTVVCKVSFIAKSEVEGEHTSVAVYTRVELVGGVRGVRTSSTSHGLMASAVV